jgi:hypothetical protein
MASLKKSIFLLAITVVVLMFMIFNAPSSFSQPNQDQLEGTWIGHMTVEIPPGMAPVTDLMTFAPGGVLIESRRLYLPNLPMGSILETTGHGKWMKTGDQEYEALIVFPLQGAPNNTKLNGTFIGTTHVHFRLKLNQDRTELGGTFASEVHDPEGNVAFTANGIYNGAPVDLES